MKRNLQTWWIGACDGRGTYSDFARRRSSFSCWASSAIRVLAKSGSVELRVGCEWSDRSAWCSRYKLVSYWWHDRGTGTLKASRAT